VELTTDQQLDHLCRNPPCINVDHLEVVSTAENTRRGKNAKLSHEDVHQVRDLMAQGWDRHDIGEAYGVTGKHVARIASGQRWRDAA
jgi:hypothetical protein